MWGKRRPSFADPVLMGVFQVIADAFDFKEVIDHVVLDLSDAHFWDITGVGTLDKAVIRFRRAGTSVELVGLNEPGAAMVERFAIHDKPGAEKLLAAH